MTRTVPDTEQDRLDVSAAAAALASMPGDTVLSHHSAAALWGLFTPGSRIIEVTTAAQPRGSRFTTGVQRRTVVAHRARLPSADVTTCDGLPVTTPVRTWLDLASVLDRYDLVAAGDSVLKLDTSRAELAERARTARRVRGIVRARSVVGLLDARSRSRPESRIRAALLFDGLPLPRVNEAIADEHGGWLAEPDLHYPEAKVAIEYNGSVHATVERMRRDATRILGMQRADWLVLVYTSADAFRRLDQVCDDVRRALRYRAPELLTAHALARRVTYQQDQRRRISRL